MRNIVGFKPIEAVILRNKEGEEIRIIKSKSIVKMATDQDLFEGVVTFVDEQSIRVEGSPIYFWEQIIGLEVIG